MYDVVIVGAGCAGLIAAYELRHLNVLLIEQAQEIGGRIMTRCHNSTSYDLGAVFALKQWLLPFHCTLSPLVPESKQVGLFYRGHVYHGRDVVTCLKNVGMAAADWETITAFATGRSSDLAAVSPETRKILQAFFHVIHPGAMQEYVPARQRDAFQTFSTDHYQHGNGEFLTYLQTFFTNRLRLGTEVLAVAEHPDRVAVTLHRRGATSIIAAHTVIVATPAPAALRILTAPGARCRSFLQSLQYAGGVVVAMGFAGAPLPEFSYIVTPELPCNTILKQTHPDTDSHVLLVYYVGEEARQLQECNEAHIVAHTLSLLQQVIAGEALADKLTFSDVHRWPLIGPILSPHSYVHWDETCLRPSPHVFLAGDYTHVDPADPLPYGMSAAIASGVKAAHQVNAYFQPYTGAADFRQRCLIDVCVYAMKKAQPLFLRRKEEGNIAFYGLLLQAQYDAHLHDYLLNCRQDSLWEYHSGFGVTAEDSTLVMDALLAVPQDAAVLARSAQRLVELFYCPSEGAFCTLSPQRHTVAACAKGRARYWEGPSVDATAQAGYLLHNIAPEAYAREIAACADYIARHQHPTGHWKGRWFPSTLITTYYAVRFLHRMAQWYRSHIDKARHYMVTSQQADGSWGHAVIDTAAAMLAFKAVGEAPPPQATAWLQAQRGPTGWRGEPVLYYWSELNIHQKLFYHCTDKGQITTAWATLALQ
jgi:predicted NAD/FAD-dependent oxidoreductase